MTGGLSARQIGRNGPARSRRACLAADRSGRLGAVLRRAARRRLGGQVPGELATHELSSSAIDSRMLVSDWMFSMRRWSMTPILPLRSASAMAIGI